MKTAVVTGANKGIGFHIARRLAAAGCRVVLACRDAARAEEAGAEIRRTTSAEVKVLVMDVADSDSVASAAERVHLLYPEGFHILVNNAGFAFKMAAVEPFGAQAEKTVGVNYFGTLAVCANFIPLMVRDGTARVVNVGSMAGELSCLTEVSLRRELMNDTLSVEDLSGYMLEFIALAQIGKHRERGWPDNTYRVSKVGVHMLTRILSENAAFRHVKINVCCPGHCRTDMAGQAAPKSAEQGAETPVWLALEAPSQTLGTGEYYKEKVKAKF